MKTRSLAQRLLVFSVLSPLLTSCGTPDEDSKLKANPTTVHRYNSNGSGLGVTGSWLSQTGRKSDDGSITLEGEHNNDLCAVFGPYNSYAPVNGVGHIDAQIDLILRGGSVMVDLISQGAVHERRIIDAPIDAERVKQTITLNGPVFDQPLKDVEVRVCQPRPKDGKSCDEHFAGMTLCVTKSQLYLKVLETRIIYN